MAKVYLGIGSNLGDKKNNIENAYDMIRSHDIRIISTSSLIETEPVGGPPQDNYLNGAIEIETNHSPHKLLQILKNIEKLLGRKASVRNGPRIIDLDILLYDDIVIEDHQLTIPHPRMLSRDFVLNPLKEIAPDLVYKLTYANN